MILLNEDLGLLSGYFKHLMPLEKQVFLKKIIVWQCLRLGFPKADTEMEFGVQDFL